MGFVNQQSQETINVQLPAHALTRGTDISVVLISEFFCCCWHLGAIIIDIALQQLSCKIKSALILFNKIFSNLPQHNVNQ